MRQGIQTLFQEAGESACYAFSICELGERISGKHLDVEAAFEQGFKLGDIYYNEHDQNDPDNFFVRAPDAFMALVSGKKASVRKEPDVNYRPRDGEYIVQCWERQVTGKTITHFRLPDWDPLLDSETVKRGALKSLRVFKVW